MNRSSPMMDHELSRNAPRLNDSRVPIGSRFRFWRTSLLIAILLCVGLTTRHRGLAAGGDVAELTQLVPANVGLVVEVRGLTEQTKNVLASPIAQRIQHHSAWHQVLKSPDMEKLKTADKSVRLATERSITEWLDLVLGREAILAISPADPAAGEKVDRPQSVLLTRLRQREDLTSILAAWNKLESRVETRFDYRGHPYFSRAKENQPESAVFFTQIEDVLVLSDRESSLKPVIDLFKKDPASQCLANSQHYQKSLQLLNSTAPVRVFIQPAIWVAKDKSEIKPPRDAGERFFRQAWRSSQAIAIGVRLESGIISEVVVVNDELASNPTWRQVVERVSGSPAFLARVPRSALFAFAGRHDLSVLLEWSLNQLPPEQLNQWKTIRQMVRGILMGRDLLDDIIPLLPADFGGFVAPRQNLDLAAAPIDGLIAVSLPSKDSPETPPSKAPFRSALNNAAQTGFSMLTAFHNASAKDNATLEDEELNGVNLHWIKSLGPYQPAYALSPDHLLVASSPQLIRDFLKQSATETWAADSELGKFRQACFADASQVLALQGRLVRDFVGQHREFFIQQVVATHKLTPDQAAKRLDRMLEWIQLSDAVVIATTFSTGHVKVVLGIAVDGPAEKR
jgi:hypothetical protein